MDNNFPSLQFKTEFSTLLSLFMIFRWDIMLISMHMYYVTCILGNSSWNFIIFSKALYKVQLHIFFCAFQRTVFTYMAISFQPFELNWLVNFFFTVYHFFNEISWNIMLSSLHMWLFSFIPQNSILRFMPSFVNFVTYCEHWIEYNFVLSHRFLHFWMFS